MRLFHDKSGSGAGGFFTFNSVAAALGAGQTRHLTLNGLVFNEWDASFLMGIACTIKNLRVLSELAPGAGESVIFTIKKNGIATALTCTVGAAATTASDLVNTVSFAAGDRMSLEAVNSVAGSAGSQKGVVEIAA